MRASTLFVLTLCVLVGLGVAIADIVSGMFAAYGVVLALFARQRTGLAVIEGEGGEGQRGRGVGGWGRRF